MKNYLFPLLNSEAQIKIKFVKNNQNKQKYKSIIFSSIYPLGTQFQTS